MKVSQVLAILSQMDPKMEVAIEQIFREHRSIQLRSVEIVNGCVVFKDHMRCENHANPFIAFDGDSFEVPILAQRLVPRI